MKKSEKIEGYLHGRMSHIEAEAFEQEIAADANLAHEVEMQRFELGVIGQLETDALRAKIKALRQEEASKTRAVARALNGLSANRFRWWAAAAASLVLLVAALFLLPKADAADRLVAGDYRRFPPDYSGNLKAATDAPAFAALPLDILRKRDKSRANVAVQYFQSFTTSDIILQGQARLNFAHALLLANKTEQAVQVFGEIERSAQNDSSIRQAAQYYSALARIQKKDFDQARALLENIAAQPAHDYQSQAARMLPLVESLR